jgi:acetolactate synthase-1/2/3 large subunit
VVFVTRGPGATNAAPGIHVARQDSTPLVMFVGQIDLTHRDREAFQEVDYRAVFGPLAKWAAEVETTERLPEYIHRAFHVARSGRPGPVVLALPENVLSARTGVADRAPTVPAVPAVGEDTIAAISDALAAAEHPLAIVGGPGWSDRAARDLQRFAEAWDLPVAVTFRRQDRLDNRSPAYAGDLGVGGNPALQRRLAAADLLLALGTRLGDIATAGYTTLDPANFATPLVHVHPDADEIGRVYPATLAVPARAPDVVARLAQVAPTRRWPDWTAAARADYLGYVTPRETPGAVKMEAVVGWLSDQLPEDAILTNGAGNYAAFLHRYFTYKRYGTQVAPTSGSMGYGLPAAIAAKLEHPARTVVCLAGDGCYQMTGNELATAAQYGAAVIVVVANNGQYGTIRMHQERTYPGRVSGTQLVNPDFAALARAVGGHGETVTRTEDFAAAFDRARASGTVAVIELWLEAEALGTGVTLSEARAQGEARK